MSRREQEEKQSEQRTLFNIEKLWSILCLPPPCPTAAPASAMDATSSADTVPLTPSPRDCDIESTSDRVPVLALNRAGPAAASTTVTDDITDVRTAVARIPEVDEQEQKSSRYETFDKCGHRYRSNRSGVQRCSAAVLQCVVCSLPALFRHRVDLLSVQAHLVQRDSDHVNPQQSSPPSTNPRSMLEMSLVHLQPSLPDQLLILDTQKRGISDTVGKREDEERLTSSLRHHPGANNLNPLRGKLHIQK